MSFNHDKSHTLTVSLRKERFANPPIYFLNNPLEEVQSFKLLSLTISHDHSWANHISKLTFKAGHQLGILCHTKSFLGTPELRTTFKAFIHSLNGVLLPTLGWLSLIPWKTRSFILLESTTMKLSL